MTLYELIPDAQALLELEPEEIGAALLKHLHHPGVSQHDEYHASGILPPISQHYPAHRDRVAAALSEGWMWLSEKAFSSQSRTIATAG